MNLFSNEHIFSFYSKTVSNIVKNKSQDIQEILDPELAYRLGVILRFEKGDKFILFDQSHNIFGVLLNINPKKSITIEIKSIEVNNVLKPNITWILPVLKKEAFDEALYTLTELGANVIQPLVTKKAQRRWGDEKEILRSQKIMIAAAEQSKQYVVPELMPIMPFEFYVPSLKESNHAKIFFDLNGDSADKVIANLKTSKNIIILSGPEGDLAPDEKEILKECGFIFCNLTQTTLRAQQAVAVGLGVLRSFLR